MSLGNVVNRITGRRGRKIWDSTRTIKVFEKEWYEDLARLKVYQLIASVYKPEMTLLDAGCGVGFDAERILGRFGQIGYTGVDTSRKMIDRCQKKLGKRYPSAIFEEGDTFNLDYKDQSFDTVISCNVLVHVPNFAIALRELCRVCKQHLIMQFNYIDEQGAYLAEMTQEEFDKRFLDKESMMYFVYYNPKEIVSLCSDHGFAVAFEDKYFLTKYNREAVVLQFDRR